MVFGWLVVLAGLAGWLVGWLAGWLAIWQSGTRVRDLVRFLVPSSEMVGRFVATDTVRKLLYLSLTSSHTVSGRALTNIDTARITIQGDWVPSGTQRFGLGFLGSQLLSEKIKIDSRLVAKIHVANFHVEEVEETCVR